MSAPLRLLCSAGEVSGDLLLAPVVQALLARPGLTCLGQGGQASQAAGLEMLGHVHEVATNGLLEAVERLPAVLRSIARLSLSMSRADVVLLVDAPELNFRLQTVARLRGLPVYWLAPPQAWAWRPWRARDLRSARRVLCTLPFEASFFVERGVDAHWVGHPAFERGPLPPSPTPGLALLPGSRSSVTRRSLPIIARLARELSVRAPTLPLHVPVAPGLRFEAFVEAFAQEGVNVSLHHTVRAALSSASAAVCQAGTATLDCVALGRPVITFASLGRLSAAVARALVRVDHLALPNLILGRRAFPELVFRPDAEPDFNALVDLALDIVGRPEVYAEPLAEVVLRMRVPEPYPFGERVARHLNGP